MDSGLSIFDSGDDVRGFRYLPTPDEKNVRLRFSDSQSDNLKSQIQNLKWLGIVAIGITFAMCGAVAEAQQGKIYRIGVLARPGKLRNASK